MLILGSLIPFRTGNLCSVAGGDKDKKPKCGLLKLNESKLTCNQEDCNESHPALCLGNFKQGSKQTNKYININCYCFVRSLILIQNKNTCTGIKIRHKTCNTHEICHHGMMIEVGHIYELFRFL